MVDTFKCHTSHPVLPATEPLSLGQLRNGGRNYHFQGTVDSKTILIKTFLARCSVGICNRICQLYENLESGTYTENSGRGRATRSGELTTQKHRTTPQARGDLLLQLTENLETLIRRASEQTAFARTAEHGQVHITNESVMDGNSSTPLRRESSESRNPQVRDYNNFLPVTSKSDQ